MLNRAAIAALIPHAGRMCLLDEVLSYTPVEAICASHSHLLADHPLRRDGQLSALHLIEYAAQAAAVHGALTASADAPREAGLLAAVRGVELAVSRLDDLPDSLHLCVRRVAANPQGRIYRFEARAGERLIGSGSLVIIVER
ncbi:hypothetical protein [Nevskia sp.]|uniref:hypothetical protein n=1 Tax=Nevskia sp. TaxID=1929292 RepID=UPI0025DEF89D|nr:hypothetical protein [Nevskia sp.]